MAETIDKRAAMVDRPGVVLRWLYRRFFRAVAFEDDAAAKIRAAAARGPVVYVLPAVSYMAYLYFSYALKRHGLPLARFANGGVRTVLLWPLHVVVALLVVLWRFARGARVEAEEDTVARLVDDGHAVLIFLRPARVLVDDAGAASSVRGKFFEKLVALSRRRAAAGAPPVQMVPLTLVLGRPLVRLAGPRGQAKGALDTIFGEPEAPGRIRAFFQFTWHHRSSQVLVAEPLDVQAFVAAHGDTSDESIARMLRFEVSGRIELDRRVLMGPPVKSARRLRLDVLRSRRLIKVVDQLAARDGAPPRAAIVKRAYKMVGEIAAYPRQWTFDLFRRALSIVFERMYEGVDVDEEGLERLREATRRGPLVLLPSHKSHIDYLILSYVFYERGLAPPHIAAGKNLSFFPMGFLFRRCAAFFLRRSFRGDPLYTAVFEAYVRRLLRDGFSMEFFIEGGRSRTGKLLPPRYGLLGVVSDAVLDGDAPEAQVVPIAISYEKIVEERSYARELAGGAKKKEGLGSLLRAGRVLGARYGRIELVFGKPFGMGEALRAAGAEVGGEGGRRRAVQRLGHRVVFEIAQSQAVTPTALVAAAMLASGARALARKQLDEAVRFLCLRAAEGGARFSVAVQDDLDAAIARAVQRMASSGDLEVRGRGDDEIVTVPFERRIKLEFYKNNLIHALADLSIVARALLAAGADRAGAEVGAARERARAASRLLKKELIFRPGQGFERAFDETLAWLERTGMVARAGERVAVSPGDGEWLQLIAGLTDSYLESYAVAVSVAAPGRAPTLSERLTPGGGAKKDAPSRLMAAGERLLLLGDIRRREALSRPVLENAWAYLREVGALEDRAKLEMVRADLLAAGVTPPPAQGG